MSPEYWRAFFLCGGQLSLDDFTTFDQSDSAEAIVEAITSGRVQAMEIESAVRSIAWAMPRETLQRRGVLAPPTGGEMPAAAESAQDATQVMLEIAALRALGEAPR